jgi:ribosomal 30S subunit maturation factor RimM
MEFTTFTLGRTFPNVVGSESEGRVVLFDAGTRKLRQEKLNKLTGDLAELKTVYEREHDQAVIARQKATTAREAAERAEGERRIEESEEKTALENYNKKVAEIQKAGGTATPIAPARK